MLVAQGRTIGQACKEAELTEQSYYRWRKEYGGLEIEQAKRFKELERENDDFNMMCFGDWSEER